MGADLYEISSKSGIGIIFIGKEIPSEIAYKYGVLSYIFPLCGGDPDRWWGLDFLRHFWKRLPWKRAWRVWGGAQRQEKKKVKKRDKDKDLDPYIQFDNFFEEEDSKGAADLEVLVFGYIKPCCIHIFPLAEVKAFDESVIGPYETTMSCRGLTYEPTDYPGRLPEELEPYILSLPEHEKFSAVFFSKDKVYLFNYTKVR